MKTKLISNIALSKIGVFSAHEKDLLIDRPKGSGDYLFLHFPDPIKLKDSTGLFAREENACIVYGPDSPQWYIPVKGDMLHHFIHFDGKDVVPLLDYAGIPVNTVFYPEETLFICQFLSMILTEFIIDEPFHKDIGSQLLSIFLLKVGRAIALKNLDDALTPEDRFNQQRLETIRFEMKNNPGLKWSVDHMAERIHMSASHFYSIYRQTFGSTPMKDLESFRMRLARLFLVSSTDTISSIAEKCGYANVYYFSNVFKKYHGTSPKNYRKAILYNRELHNPVPNFED